MTSKRKPYVRETKPTWWKKLGFYRFYMMREATSIPTVWFCLVLLYGAYSFSCGESQTIKFIGFLQNPLVLLLNTFALIAALFHAKTWFLLFPKSATIIINNKKIPDLLPVILLWLTTLVISIIILTLALNLI